MVQSADTLDELSFTGGGIIQVPALVYLLHFPVYIATATSHFISVIMALTGTLVHIVTDTFVHGVHRTGSLAIGVVIGAQVGAHLSQKTKTTGLFAAWHWHWVW